MAFVSPLSLRTSATRRTSLTARRPQMMVAVNPPATAAATATGTSISQRAAELTSYIQGHKTIFRPGAGFNSTTVTLFRKNDTAKMFTPLDELATNSHMLPAGEVAVHMVVNADPIFNAAMDTIVAACPAVKEDPELAAIVSFNITALLRIVSYAAACQSTDFVHDNNIAIMKMLHDEVGLPPNAFIDALDVAQEHVVSAISDATLVESATDCFEIVRSALA